MDPSRLRACSWASSNVAHCGEEWVGVRVGYGYGGRVGVRWGMVMVGG